MAYTKESSDIPYAINIRPTFDVSQVVTAVRAEFNYKSRIRNDTDSTDVVERETAVRVVDLLDNVKTVSLAGGVTLTYRQIASALKKVADAER